MQIINSDQDYPLVVACLATRNGESFITDTLATLAAQTYPNLKVLISDDASTDNTATICKEFAVADPRFQVVQQPQQLGWIGNVNALLKIAQGDYFFFMPHDDRLESSYVMRLVETLETHPTAILAFCDIECIHYGRREIQTYTDLDGVKNRVIRGYKMLQEKSHWCVPYRGIFRSFAVARIGGLRPNLAGEFAADWYWLLHLSLLGEFIRVPEVLYQRIRGNQSLSRTWKYTVRPWIAATLACGNEVYRSELPLIEKAILQILVAGSCLRWLWRAVLYRIGQLRLTGN